MDNEILIQAMNDRLMALEEKVAELEVHLFPSVNPVLPIDPIKPIAPDVPEDKLPKTPAEYWRGLVNDSPFGETIYDGEWGIIKIVEQYGVRLARLESDRLNSSPEYFGAEMFGPELYKHYPGLLNDIFKANYGKHWYLVQNYGSYNESGMSVTGMPRAIFGRCGVTKINGVKPEFK